MAEPSQTNHTVSFGRRPMQSLFHRFAKDESGATAIEYGLIASLISVAIFAAATQLGTNVSSTFDAVSAQLK